MKINKFLLCSKIYDIILLPLLKFIDRRLKL